MEILGELKQGVMNAFPAALTGAILAIIVVGVFVLLVLQISGTRVSIGKNNIPLFPIEVDRKGCSVAVIM